MRTDDLIQALAADAQARPQPIGVTITVALATGLLPSAAVLFLVIGVRPDFGQAIETARVLFKFAAVLTLAVPAAALSIRLARPGASVGLWGWALVAAPLLLALGVTAELLAVPSASWAARLVGSNSVHCLTVIPLLSLAPLAAMTVALRFGAPTRFGLAGGAAGLAAGAVAALLYAMNCPDDSPLFVATWYPIAIGIVAAAGGLLGRRMLRW